MRVDRVLKRYTPVLDYKEKENVYKQIINDYSVVNISASDFAVLMDVESGMKYVPKKIGKQELKQKEENSKILREKTAELAAGYLCTEPHGLKKYKHLALLLDYSATKEAWNQNKKDSEVFIHGSKADKTKLFWDKLNPLLTLKKSVLEEKKDVELVKNWSEWQPLFQQFCVLDKIVEEAKELEIEISPQVAGRMKTLQENAMLSVHMLNCRAGIVSNVYYSRLNEEDIQKIDKFVLEKISKKVPMPLEDYIQDNVDVLKYTDAHIEKQLQEKLEQIAKKYPKEITIGNIKGQPYEYEKAVEVLKNQKPVYVLGENKKLINMIQLAGNDGFLKTMVNKKQTPLLSDYLKKDEVLIEKMISEKRPLSEEGVKMARLYMAKKVCYDKIVGERLLGNGQLYRAFAEDEQKFVKASNKIYKDPAFEKLTKDITLEQLEDFVVNGKAIELHKKYVQEIMAPEQEKEVILHVAL